MKTLIEEVHLGSQEQARGIERVSQAISQMEQVTQQTAAAAEEGAAAGEQMSAQSDTLREVVGRMAALLDGVAHREDVRPGVERALGIPSRSLRSADPALPQAGHLSPHSRL
jgi:methyl-accepting chemotaxis protein